jgi:hypothetical protein
MIKFLVIISLLYSTTTFSQVRLNYSKSEIVSEFSEYKFRIQEFEYEGLDAVTIFTERVNLLYLFNSNNICKVSILIPHTQQDLKYFIEEYNREYVVMSDTEWKMYSNGNVSTIELIYTQGKQAFRWITN